MSEPSEPKGNPPAKRVAEIDLNAEEETASDRALDKLAAKWKAEKEAAAKAAQQPPKPPDK